MKPIARQRFTTRLFWLAVAALFICMPVQAETSSPPRTVYLTAQPLDQALQALAVMFERAFIINAKRVNKLEAAPLKGRYTLEGALQNLLRNTGLTYHISDSGIIISAINTQHQHVMEEVAVNGIRDSLNASQQQKQQSPAISDVIAARDIATYPDRNLAESLQRIPGMSITREAGEGRQIVLRGLNPDFTLITLNGMPVLANNDSPMDSRLQKHRDRSFDLNLFSTDLFSEIQVLKSYSADLPSGGLAGIAALKTAHPFDTPGLRWTVTQQVGTNQYSDALSKRLSGMLSATRGNWGALFSASYGQRDSQELGANTFRWRQIPPEGADISSLTPAIQHAWQNAQLWIPRGNRYSVWHSDMERIGIGASLEYLTEHAHVTFDWLYGTLSGERGENHLYPRGLNSTPVIAGQTAVTDAQINDRNELIYGHFQHARVGTESRFQDVTTRYQQWVINSTHQFSSHLSGHGTFGIERALYKMPLSIKAYMRGTTDVTLDYRNNYHFVDMTYADSLSTPAFWQMNELDSERYRAATEYLHASYQWDFTASNTNSWVYGASVTRFKNSLKYTDIQNILQPEWASNSVSDSVPLNAAYPLNTHPKLSWLALDPVAVFNAFDVATHPDALAYSRFTDPTTWQTDENAIVEDRLSAFLQHQWQSQRWQVISGLRVERDHTRIAQAISPADNYTLAHYNWLPAVTVNYRYQDQVYRLSASRTIGRPQLETLATTTRYNAQTASLTQFNPALRPYTSYNLDVAAESYAGDNNRLAITVFAKWLDDYIVSTATDIAVADLSAAARAQLPEHHEPETIRVISATNTEQTHVYGIEGSMQLETTLATFVPQWQAFHVGLVTNISYSQGELQYYNELTGDPLARKPLPFLSPWLANMTAYLEGYALSMRLSATYRDHYIARVDGNTLQDEDETGFEQSLYVDAVVAYQFTDNWELRLEGNNLTNEQERQYSDSSRRPYNTTVSGRNYYLGITYRY